MKLDTNGSNPQMLERLLKTQVLDFVSLDVKAPLDPASYRRAAGLPVDTGLIWRSIGLLKQSKIEYEFRMTVVPGLHSEEDIRSVGGQVKAGRRMILQNFTGPHFNLVF